MPGPDSEPRCRPKLGRDARRRRAALDAGRSRGWPAWPSDAASAGAAARSARLRVGHRSHQPGGRSRRPPSWPRAQAGERFFCIEQPGRDGYAVCGLGEAIAVTRSGTDRFEGAAADCRRIGARTLEDDQAADPGRPPGAGPVFMGGFAFAATGGATPEWSGFDPAQLVLPELSIARKGDQARLTVTVAVDPRQGAGAEALERARRRGWRDLRAGDHAAAGPQPDRSPAGGRRGRARRTTRTPCGARSSGSARARWSKVVLAREVRVQTGREIDPAPVFDALRGGFPDCYCYCVGGPGGSVRRRQPGAAGAPRRRPGADRRAGRHHPPQRRPGGGRPPGRAAAPEPQEPRRAGHRGAPHPAHAGPGQRVGRGGRGARADQGAERAAPGHAHPGPALGPGARGRAGRPAASHARRRRRAARTWPSP